MKLAICSRFTALFVQNRFGAQPTVIPCSNAHAMSLAKIELL